MDLQGSEPNKERFPWGFLSIFSITQVFLLKERELHFDGVITAFIPFMSRRETS